MYFMIIIVDKFGKDRLKNWAKLHLLRYSTFQCITMFGLEILTKIVISRLFCNGIYKSLVKISRLMEIVSLILCRNTSADKSFRWICVTTYSNQLMNSNTPNCWTLLSLWTVHVSYAMSCPFIAFILLCQFPFLAHIP